MMRRMAKAFAQTLLRECTCRSEQKPKAVLAGVPPFRSENGVQAVAFRRSHSCGSFRLSGTGEPIARG
jgi:hypothetical protein